jgi:flagellar biogenesis protein FliO
MKETLVMYIVLALLIVISLIILTVFLLRYILKLRIPSFMAHKSGEIGLDETLYLDNKRRLVIIRCRGKKYLLLLGQNDLVLDSFDGQNSVSLLERE